MCGGAVVTSRVERGGAACERIRGMDARGKVVRVAAIGVVAVAILFLMQRRAAAPEVESEVEVREGPSAAPPPSASEPPPLHRVERQLMGTVWSVSIPGGDEARARAAGERALDEVARLERILSEWIPESEISRVNAAAGESAVTVGPELLACIQASQDVAQWSDGAYDISWAALRDLWRFGTNGRDVPPSPADVAARMPLWNYQRIRVDTAARTVMLEQRGMQIGLGGVAKGYALDRMHAMLVAEGFQDFMLYAGGQVLVRGLRGDRKWRVGIQHPRQPRYFAFVEVTNASVATSGDYEHAFEYEGRRYHHILDPHTGFPSERSTSVTVIAPTGLAADAVDTAVFVLGPEEGLARLARAPGGPIEAIIVDPEMRIFATPGGATSLVLRAALDAAWHIGPELPRGQPDVRLSELPPPVR